MAFRVRTLFKNSLLLSRSGGIVIRSFEAWMNFRPDVVLTISCTPELLLDERLAATTLDDKSTS